MGKQFSSIINKKARHDYEVLDTLEAGLVLTGPEVKSLRLGRAALKDSHVVITTEGTAKLVNAHISPYQFARLDDYDPTQSRPLLLKKSQIEHLRGKLQQKGISLIPLKIYLKRGRFKVELGLVRGKKQFQKKETKKRKDIERDTRRLFKDHTRYKG